MKNGIERKNEFIHTSDPLAHDATIALHANGIPLAPGHCLPCSLYISSNSTVFPWHSCNVICCK